MRIISLLPYHFYHLCDSLSVNHSRYLETTINSYDIVPIIIINNLIYKYLKEIIIISIMLFYCNLLNKETTKEVF